MPAGSLQQWQFGLTDQLPASDLPYPISGATWEYVARSSATDAGTPLIRITTDETTAGQITVTSTASVSSVLLDIFPLATAALNGTYWHALWINPGLLSAQAIFGGAQSLLIVSANAQP
jgi:hypothetical protein